MVALLPDDLPMPQTPVAETQATHWDYEAESEILLLPVTDEVWAKYCWAYNAWTYAGWTKTLTRYAPIEPKVVIPLSVAKTLSPLSAYGLLDARFDTEDGRDALKALDAAIGALVLVETLPPDLPQRPATEEIFWHDAHGRLLPNGDRINRVFKSFPCPRGAVGAGVVGTSSDRVISADENGCVTVQVRS